MGKQNTGDGITAERQRYGGNMKFKTGRGSASPLRKILVLLSMLLISACGGSGGGGVTGPSSIDNSVFLASSSPFGGDNTVSVDVKVYNVSEVYGAAFDLDFDSTKMTYVGYSNGSFLEQGGVGVIYLISSQPGKLVVGISRGGAVSGVSGSGTLVTLKFTATSSSSVSFSNNSLKDPSNHAISGTTWSGGTVKVQ